MTILHTSQKLEMQVRSLLPQIMPIDDETLSGLLELKAEAVGVFAIIISGLVVVAVLRALAWHRREQQAAQDAFRVAVNAEVDRQLAIYRKGLKDGANRRGE